MLGFPYSTLDHQKYTGESKYVQRYNLEQICNSLRANTSPFPSAICYDTEELTVGHGFCTIWLLESFSKSLLLFLKDNFHQVIIHCWVEVQLCKKNDNSSCLVFQYIQSFSLKSTGASTTDLYASTHSLQIAPYI